MRAETYQPILAILDEGLWLYRRHFARFVLIATVWLVPMAIVVGLVAVAISWAESTPAALLRLAGGLASVIVMFVYLIGGLSRGAVAAAEGRDVRLREAWAMRPLRAIKTSVAAVIYGFFAQLIYGSLSLAFGGLIPLMVFAPSSAQYLWVSMIVAFAAGSVTLTVAIGMPYSTLVYTLQPWLLETRSWRQTFERSNGLVLADVGACFLTTLLLVTIGLNIVVVPAWALLANTNVSVGAPILFCIGIITVTILFPLLPIWMALLYHRETSAYSGADLAARVAEWQGQHAAPGVSRNLHTSGIPSTMPPAELRIVD